MADLKQKEDVSADISIWAFKCPSWLQFFSMTDSAVMQYVSHDWHIKDLAANTKV